MEAVQKFDILEVKSGHSISDLVAYFEIPETMDLSNIIEGWISVGNCPEIESRPATVDHFVKLWGVKVEEDVIKIKNARWY
ncbi:MAG: hypothetical protein ACYS76_09605 [Planctomycetota bacterium]|jgi:hypothetical protein